MNSHTFLHCLFKIAVGCFLLVENCDREHSGLHFQNGEWKVKQFLVLEIGHSHCC